MDTKTALRIERIQTVAQDVKCFDLVSVNETELAPFEAGAHLLNCNCPITWRAAIR